MKIVLIGQIASGKGTLSQSLQKEFGFEPISIGLLLRQESMLDTKEAKEIRELLDRGSLVPDEVALAVLKKHLKQIGDKSIIFDGYPRNLKQAKSLNQIAKIDKVIFLDIDEEVIRERFMGRRECEKCGYVSNVNYGDYQPTCPRCGGSFKKRGDNNEIAMLSKMNSFREDTLPVIDYYSKKGLLCKIDATQSIEQIQKQAEEIIKSI